MTTPSTTSALTVQTRGAVTSEETEHARSRIGAALRYAHDPVLSVRVRLTRLPDPALARPAVAQANVDHNGRLVRAQVARPTMHEAIDELHDRVRDRLERSARDWESIRGGRPERAPHEWRHESPPAERQPHFPRPVDERQIVRHKTFSLPRASVDDAAHDMDMLDYDFHLFLEQGSGTDSVLYRTSDGAGHRLAQVDPQPDRVAAGTTPFTVSALPAVRLTVDEAVERLEASAWPFVFFCDATTGRGCVIYHRYDGHYGLIVPAG